MKVRARWSVGLLAVGLIGLAAPAAGQVREVSTVESAVTVLDEIMAIPLKQIPRSLLAEAEGVAIVPGVVKIGFVAGLRRGRGVLLLKDSTGAWTPPQFITLTGGSVGWQAGLQATDVILVFKSRRSIQGLVNGTLTLGADAAVAAGPVGRNAGAATDAGLKAEIYTYSRSRGLFAGVSLDGTVIEVDSMANAFYYGTQSPPGAPGQPSALPPSAVKLMERLARYSQSSYATGPTPAEGLAPPQPAGAEESIRRQLADSAQGLYGILDEPWRAYLALPGAVFETSAPPSLTALNEALGRFDTVASDPRYRALAQRPEFQATHRLLRQYALAQSAKVSQRLELPPPPAGRVGQGSR